MKVTFLGTGNSQGIPVLNNDHPVCFSTDKRDKRLRVSILLEWDHVTYVVDCGPDFRYQMLRANVRRLDGIIFTHIHSDHTAGFDDIRPYCFAQGPIPIYADQYVLDNLARRFDYAFHIENKYPGAPSVITNPIQNKPFELDGKLIEPVEYFHGGVKVYGYKIEGFAYITDIKVISEEEKEKIKNLDILVLSVVRRNEMHSHLNLEQALALIEELQPKQAYLTHLSHHLGFHADLEEELPEHVHVAYDGLILNM